MNICRGNYKASDKTVLSINANAVLITIVIEIIFLPKRASKSFSCSRFGLLFHPPGR